MKKIFTHWTIGLLTLAILTIIGLGDPQIKEILRLKSFDLILQSETKEVSPDIGVVTIDEKSIEKYGQWPWDRRILADLVIKLREAQVGIIVMPILFSEYDRMGGDEAFVNTINQMGVVIAQVGTTQINKNAVPRGVAKIGDPLPWLYEWPGMLGPIPELGQYADGVGVINTAPEIDGVVRRVPLIMRIGEETYPAMALETIRVATGDPSYQIKAGEGGVIAVRVPGYDTIATDPHARIWLRWNKEFDTISASEEDFSEFAGRTVIIGITAEGLSSIIATPLGEKHDYILSASTLQTVLDGEQINRYDYSLFLELIISIFLGMSIVILARFTPYWVIGLTMILSYVILVFTSHYLFTEYLILADVSWSIICLTIVGMHSIFNRFVLEFQLKQQIRKQFETYLDPRQVAILQKDPSKLKLGGERREMSFLFMDIVGFTPISEYYKNNDDPEGLVEVVNDYLNRMTKIVLDNGGCVDKYMGDCIMAFWNAPLDCEDHAEMAVKTAIECAEETENLKVLFKEKGLPDINIGSGVNTGTCIVGNMGSDTRFDYSVIGDAVNLAARLEATTRNYKTDDGGIVTTLYSSYTQEKLKNIKSVEVDKIKVKGKEELITIYKPV
ncbi:MAG: adenylate/guanylate cyclase domain-containing protein [Candidatus Pelagibacter sp.]|nr:adenylate/guanylate cyclase domain-containing protein [Candidatus Pelagibacter sp.]